MINYFWGLIKYLFFLRISLFAQITTSSKLSKKVKVGRFAKIFKSSVDDYSYIGSRTWLVNVNVGKFCSIAQECNIGMGNHTLNHISTSPIFTERRNGTGSSWIDKNTNCAISLPSYIGNDVWIGTKAMIMNGVTIGDGAVIAAGSIVTKDVPSYAIVGGIPAKIIRYRFDEKTIDALLESRWWDKTAEELKKHLDVFQKENPQIDDIKKIK